MVEMTLTYYSYSNKSRTPFLPELLTWVIFDQAFVEVGEQVWAEAVRMTLIYYYSNATTTASLVLLVFSYNHTSTTNQGDP